MITFVELQLGHGWHADPNAPEPQVSVAGSSVNVRSRSCRLWRGSSPKLQVILRSLKLFSDTGPRSDETWGTLNLIDCSRWRWDDTNDHEWYKEDGHGRYSGIAPSWGKFYELVGEDPIRDAVPWEVIQVDTATARHFLFYFRDETFEFMAEDWSFTPDRIV